MSGNNDDETKQEAGKVFPLDLASKLTMKPVEIPKGTSIMMTQPLRGMRVLTQAAGNVASGATVAGQTISIVPQAMIKQGIISSHGQPQSQASSGITVARPAQITLTTSVLGQQPPAGATYHVPRGPAVVANLATPRSAVATPIRATTPTGQQSATGFVAAVRQVAPARTPSPAGTTSLPGTTWLSGSGMQVPSGTQLVKSVIHSFKSTSGIQSLGNTVTLTQVLPTRTQTLVYSGSNTQHFTTTPRIAVTGTINSQRQANTARPAQVMTTRLTVPVNVSQGSNRLTVTPTGPGTIYTTGPRLPAVPVSAQNTVIGVNTARVTTSSSHQTATVNRVAVNTPTGALLTTTPTRLAVGNSTQQQPQVQPQAQAQPAVVITTQAGRIAASVVSLHPVVVANSSQTVRTIQTHGQKVIAQPSQGASIQLTQMPTIGKIPTQQVTVVPVAATSASTASTRTISVTPTLANQRPISMSVTPAGAQAIPIAKVFPQGGSRSTDAPDGSLNAQQTNQSTNVFIHTGSIVRQPTSPASSTQVLTETQRTAITTTASTYPALSAATTYYYESPGSGYTVTGAANLVARSYTPSTSPFSTASAPQAPAQIRSTAMQTQVHGLMSGQSLQFNPVMVVEQKRTGQFLDNSTGNGNGSAAILQQSPSTAMQQQEHLLNPLPSIGKITSSPRPSILRKRDNDGSPLKAAKNLVPVLANLPASSALTSAPTTAPASPPSRPESRDNGGQSSGGSTTISATSSPGLGEMGDDSLPLPPVSGEFTPVQAAVLKLEQQQQEEERPLMEMSPRKKPRKQQLPGNDLHEPKFSIDDMQFLSENKIKKESEDNCLQIRETILQTRNEVTVRKPTPASLLNSYRQTWKSTQNHYMRYTDVKPKDERRPTIIDLANQSHVLQKINGWKIYHLSTQMEDLSDLEAQVYGKLSSVLKLIETKDCSSYDREFNRINELIKGNMQRSKIINDSVLEAKDQIMKVFDHKDHVADIINRCASKRNFKKRDKF